MELYIFLLLFSSCSGQYFSEIEVNVFSVECTFLQNERQCLRCRQVCAVAKELYGYTTTFNGNGRAKITIARKTDTLSEANKTSTADRNDNTFYQFNSHVSLDRTFMTMFGVAVLLFSGICLLYIFRKSRSTVQCCGSLRADRCPQMPHLNEERESEELGRRSVICRPCCSTLAKDCDVLLHKKHVETPESSKANVTDECKTTKNYSFEDPTRTPEKQTTNPDGNLEEVPNSEVLDEIRALKERMVCKVCLDRKMCVVFLPCNHMVTCENCSVMLDRCVVCRTVIKGTFTVYTQF